MKKKLIVTAFALVISFIVSVSFTLANTNNGAMDVVNGVRNVVGGAENAVEGAVQGVAGGIRNGTQDLEDGARNTVSGMNGSETRSDRNNDNMGTFTDDNRGYTATRTSADTNTGIGSNMWTWVILALVAFAIIALIWAYIRQNNYSEDKSDNNL